MVVSANDKFSAGILTLQVGEMTEEISVIGRVSELQATSGERSFTLESEALKNIANNGRALFNFANLVPGAVQNGTSGTENAQVSAFTVNGQRPNSNNMTIDGVANIDTGDNGGNMATTNIDAVAEFKLLTNAYQAEYGRAVGGQLQVVTKSGTQAFHGSGYWYGRRSDWNANTWTNKRAAAPPPVGNGALIEPAKSSRNDYGYTIGGPIYIPGVFNEEKKKLFFFWSQEYQRRSDPAAERQARVPTALERRGRLLPERRRERQPVPLHPRLPDRAALQRGQHERAASRTAASSARSPQNRLYAPGIAALNIYPDAELHGAAAASTSRARFPNERAAARGPAPAGLPGHRQVALHRPLHEDEGRDHCRPTAPPGPATAATSFRCPSLFLHPGSNYMLSATGILNSTTSLEVSFGPRRQLAQLRPAAREAATARRRGSPAMPLLYPDAVQADYIP